MCLPACLVTSSPSFEEPERTPPFLVGPSAVPVLQQIKVVDTGGLPDPVEFGANVRSQDNGLGVKGHLVLDYGFSPPGGPGYPYRDLLKEVEIDPGTLDDTARPLAAKWFPGANKASSGCHNVTLMASHDFDPDTGCPRERGDFDFLIWTVIACDSTQAPCCDPSAPEDKGGCTKLECPVIDPNARCDKSGGAP